MRRLLWPLFCIAALAGCGGSPEPPPNQVPVASAEEEGPYENAVYAEQRAEWEITAAQGDPLAQRQLGVMYYIGQGIERDYAKAFELFSQAAGKSDGIAQYYLGVMYTEGQCAARDVTQAHMWLSLAAQQGNANAQARVDKLAEEMKPEEIATAQKLVEEWQPDI